MLTPETIAALTSFLARAQPAEILTFERQMILMLKGAVYELRADSSDSSAEALFTVTASCPVPEIQNLAVSLLGEMAVAGNSIALNDLFNLVIEYNSPQAREIIELHSLSAPSTGIQAAYRLLTDQVTFFQKTENALGELTAFFKSANPSIRNELIQIAAKNNLKDWVTLARVLDQPKPTHFKALLESYPHLQLADKQLVLENLKEFAQTGLTDAVDTLAHLFLNFDEDKAREILINLQKSPSDSVLRAHFYFLSGLWSQYEQVDFDHKLLASAYETGSSDIRKKLLAQSRYAGHADWLRTLAGATRARWVSEMSDTDWENALKTLSDARRFEDLWKLTFSAPPFWGARLIERLSFHGWLPDREDEAHFLQEIIPLVRNCLHAPLVLQRPRKVKIPPGSVTGITLSPSGRTLAAGRSDPAIYLWDTDTWEPRSEPVIGTSPSTRALAFSPQEEYLAAATGDYQIHLFRLPERIEVKIFSGHTNLVRGILFNPDGKTMYSVSFDGTLRSRRFPSGVEVKILDQSTHELYALALSQDGEFLISGGSDGVVRVLNALDGRTIWKLSGHGNTITCLAASPTGQLLASYGRDRAIRIWNFASGKALKVIPIPDEVGNITTLVFHPSGKVIFAGNDRGKIHLWSVSSGQAVPPYNLGEEQAAQITGIAFSPDGKQLISSSLDGSILVWDLETFLLSHSALESSMPATITNIQSQLNSVSLHPTEKSWLEFIQQILRWRQRFEIEIAEPMIIQAGEFDIQLE